MSLIQLIHSNYVDLCKRFKMPEDTWRLYIENELLNKEELVKLINTRQSFEDLWEGFPQGLPGTTLNAFCLYAIIRHFGLQKVVETGVANGFYTSFMLSAVIENKGSMDSIDISDHEHIASYVPAVYRDYAAWNLHKGVDALVWLKDKTPHDYDLCAHDSLHTKDHMSKEFEIFKNVKEGKDQFFVFFDDQNSENFWEYAFNVNMQSKNGYSYRMAEGRYCAVKGHLGGFISYSRNK